jgi:hypothetical protein
LVLNNIQVVVSELQWRPRGKTHSMIESLGLQR